MGHWTGRGHSVYKGKNIIIDFNGWQGLDEIRKLPEMESYLEEIVKAQVMPKLGEGYGYKVERGKKRLVCNIFPKTNEAYRETLKKNTLLKAIGGGSGNSINK